MCVCECVRVCVQTLIAPRPKVARSPNFATPENLRPVFWRYLARNSTTLPSGGNSALSRFSWHKVWDGGKCNFSSAHHHVQKVVGKLSSRRVRMWNFTKIRRKTKKLWLSIIQARKLSKQLGLGQPQKGVNCNFSSLGFDKPYGVRKLSILEVEICSFSRIGQKTKITAL